MVARIGAGPCPQILDLALHASCTSTGTSPPGPLRCGSTTCKVKAVATAASEGIAAPLQHARAAVAISGSL
jgi:hypothetical protein